MITLILLYCLYIYIVIASTCGAVIYINRFADTVWTLIIINLAVFIDLYLIINLPLAILMI